LTPTVAVSVRIFSISPRTCIELRRTKFSLMPSAGIRDCDG